MKAWMKWVLALVVIIALGMILAPRVWVKNKKATLYINGSKSLNLKMYHGVGENLLVELSDPLDSHTYLFTEGIYECTKSGYKAMKLLAVGWPNKCKPTGEYWPMEFGAQSAEFKSLSGNHIKITWHAPPR